MMQGYMQRGTSSTSQLGGVNPGGIGAIETTGYPTTSGGAGGANTRAAASMSGGLGGARATGY
jgi:hypothetical protein